MSDDRPTAMDNKVRDQLGCTCTALRKAGRRVSQMFDEALSPLGLRNTQYAILVELAERGAAPPCIQELAAVMVLERSGLARALKPLERGGLVTVLEDPADHRRRTVVLTARGKATERRARLLWGAAERQLSELFGEEKKKSLAVELIQIAHDPRFGAMSG